MSIETLLPEIAQIKKVLEALKQKVFTVNVDWQLFVQLFRTEPERVKLLNQAAPFLFGRVQQHMICQVVMAICRLTDPAVARQPKKGKPTTDFNLSLDLLISEVEQHEPVFGKSLRSDLDAMKEDIERLHHLRNKLLAHNDYDHAKVKADEPGPDRINYLFIDDFNKQIHKLMNRVELHYFNTETGYYLPLTPGTGDGDWLMALFTRVFAEGDPRKPRFPTG